MALKSFIRDVVLANLGGAPYLMGKNKQKKKKIAEKKTHKKEQQKEQQKEKDEHEKYVIGRQERHLKEKPPVEAEEALAREREHGEKERENILKFLQSDVQGMTPRERAAMQQEAHQSILRQEQGAQRRLLGQQSQRGITGKSGIAYAQQRELQKLGQEARQRADRDLYQLEADQARRVKAAAVAAQKGGEAQYGLTLKEKEEERKRKYNDRNSKRAADELNNYLLTKA